MHTVQPETYLVQKPSLVWSEIERYLQDVGGLDWFARVYAEAMDQDRMVEGVGLVGPLDDGEILVEFMGRLCYKSWAPGLNANVTKVRESSPEYLANVLSSLHGSVFEHAMYGFVMSHGSRVFTHELVRHRAGVAISQESMRYVRLDDLPIWQPEWALDDEELQINVGAWLRHTENLQLWMAEHFGLDDDGVPFSEKKAKTSYMRRWSPQGVATEMGWSANIRALRWIVQQRTEEHAEEEIRLIIDQVATKMKEVCPTFFGDFERDESGIWTPQHRKV